MSNKNIPKQLDRYELHERIGSGGMGMIYKGFDTRLKRPVAIKIITTEVSDPVILAQIQSRFIHEARAAGAMSHPNLVQIYDFGEVDKLAYIVMEFLQGETLEKLITSRGKLNLDELLRLAKGVSAGLAFAHKRGVVHRDIKPSNIMIEAQTGISRILDFGIAKFLNEHEMKLTSTGTVLGSTHYLSPEHISGKNLDGRSDIFCLGTLLYEAATGLIPFRGENPAAVIYKIVHKDPQLVSAIRPDLSVQFSDLIMKCLRKSPMERYQKADEIESQVIAIQNSLSSALKTPFPGASKSSRLKSYCVRDSQLFAHLETQSIIPKKDLERLKGRPVVETLMREQMLNDDEIAKVIADCLETTYIPRARLKSLKIMSEARQILSQDILESLNILPFFRDDKKKVLSVIADGTTDFLQNDKVLDTLSPYDLRVYIAPSQILHRLISTKGPDRSRTSISEQSGFFQIQALNEIPRAADLSTRRILLIDNHVNHHEALIQLFKRNENSLVIASDMEEASQKMKREKYDYIWAQRSIIGDEIDFEASITKRNPNCEIRIYEQLALELFEESLPYRKFQILFDRLFTQLLIQKSSDEVLQKVLPIALVSRKIAGAFTENAKLIDTCYYSTILWKWARITRDTSPVDQLDGVYSFRRIFECYTERFDGRGPLGLKGEEIPLATRILGCLHFLDQSHPNADTPMSVLALNELKTKYFQIASKQIDPTIPPVILQLFSGDTSKAISKKIAVVDSDKVFADQLTGYLKTFSKTVTYNDGVSALAGIKKDIPDLIVSEVILSQLDGFALCMRIRADEALKNIPIIFVSESNLAAHSTKAIQLGADDYISKASDPQFIVAKIERLLSKK